MSTIRQNKVSRVLQREMGELMRAESRNFSRQALISVTQVRISPDLGMAKIYLSIFGVENKQELLETINLHRREIRGKMGQRLRNQFRKIPEFVFYLDDSMDYYENIEKLLEQ